MFIQYNTNYDADFLQVMKHKFSGNTEKTIVYMHNCNNFSPAEPLYSKERIKRSSVKKLKLNQIPLIIKFKFKGICAMSKSRRFYPLFETQVLGPNYIYKLC